MELTHASFPLPALCFPYGNPQCVCVCVLQVQAPRGHRQSRTTTQNNPRVHKRAQILIQRQKKSKTRPRLTSLRQFGFYVTLKCSRAEMNESPTTAACDGVCVCVSERVLPRKQLDSLTKTPVCVWGQVLAVLVALLGHTLLFMRT